MQSPVSHAEFDRTGMSAAVQNEPALSAELAQPSALSAQDAQRFAQRGYLTLPAFCDPAELVHIRHLLTGLFQKKVGHDEGRQFDMLGLDIDAALMKQPQILNPSLLAPALLETDYYRRIAAIAKQLLGDDAQFSFDHSILKPPHSAVATPWHQDEAHHRHRYFRYRQISFWMPLQNTRRKNGCMRYIPRSHLGPVLSHRPVNDDPRIHALEIPSDQFDESLAVVQPVSAGACILHDGRTLHGALPNISTESRMAYIIAWVGPPTLDESLQQSPSKHISLAQPTGQPANLQRRRYWLLHGGFFTVVARRLRQGLRSRPKIIWLKLRLLADVVLARLRKT